MKIVYPLANLPKPRIFHCEMCNEEFPAINTKEKAMQETQETFNEVIAEDDCASVCDDCYKKFMHYYYLSALKF